MSVISGDPRPFRDAAAILGESIVWQGAGRGGGPSGDVLWCDITAGLLHRSPFDGPVDGSADTTISLPPPLPSFHPAAGGGFVVSLGDRVIRLDASGTEVEQLAAISHMRDGMRMNEGKVDPRGRWVTGSMNLTATGSDNAIYSISADRTLRTLRGGFGTANGFGWSADGSTMFFTDTAAETVYRGAYSDGGELDGVKAFISGGAHDGLTMDADGCLWSALYGEGRVVRYTPEGDESEVVEFPVPNVTSVAFGGPDLSTLFVASARENLTEEQLETHPLSGAIFAVGTRTHGVHPHSFGLVEP